MKAAAAVAPGAGTATVGSIVLVVQHSSSSGGRCGSAGGKVTAARSGQRTASTALGSTVSMAGARTCCSSRPATAILHHDRTATTIYYEYTTLDWRKDMLLYCYYHTTSIPHSTGARTCCSSGPLMV